MSINLLHHIRS